MNKTIKYIVIFTLNIIFIMNIQLDSWAYSEQKVDYEFKLINKENLTFQNALNEVKLEDENKYVSSKVLETSKELMISYPISLVGFVALFFLGQTIGSAIDDQTYRNSFDSGSVIKSTGFILGGTLALLGTPLISTTTVYLLGNTENETGSFFTTLLGSFIGIFTFLLFEILTFPTSISNYLFFVGFIFVPIGSIIGFNLSKYQKVIKEVSNKVKVTKNGLSYQVLSF